MRCLKVLGGGQFVRCQRDRVQAMLVVAPLPAASREGFEELERWFPYEFCASISSERSPSISAIRARCRVAVKRKQRAKEEAAHSSNADREREQSRAELLDLNTN